MAGLGAATGAEAIVALSRVLLPWFGGAALAGCAAFSFPGQPYALIALMLALPLLDQRWRPPPLPRDRRHRLAWTGLLIVGLALVFWRPIHVEFAFATLLTAALPEEWFFRAYFLTSIGTGLPANALTSLIFSLIHGLGRDALTGILVFLPSLFYGWLYQRTRDLPLLVLVHALSNLVFVMFLADWLSGFR